MSIVSDTCSSEANHASAGSPKMREQTISSFLAIRIGSDSNTAAQARRTPGTQHGTAAPSRRCLRPPGSAWSCSYCFAAEILSLAARNTNNPKIAVAEGSGTSMMLKEPEGFKPPQAKVYHMPDVAEDV